MASKTRIPKSIPRVEILEIECTCITIIRDNTGKIIGKGKGITKEIHTIDEFIDYFNNCNTELYEANKMQK